MVDWLLTKPMKFLVMASLLVTWKAFVQTATVVSVAFKYIFHFQDELEITSAMDRIREGQDLLQRKEKNVRILQKSLLGNAV